MKEKKTILLRSYLVFTGMFLIGCAIIFQIFRIQVVQGSYWKDQAKAQSLQYRNIEAVRGNIFAEDGSLLATSLPSYEIRLDLAAASTSNPDFNEKVDSLAFELSKLFKDKSEEGYRRDLLRAKTAKDRYYLLQRRVTFRQLKKLKTFPILKRGQYKGGLIVIQKNRRAKPFKVLAARTIGYEIEGVPAVGIEAGFSQYLKGVGGKQLMQKIAGGIWMPLNDENEIDPEDGSDVITSIDINVQDVAEHALLTQLARQNADHGCVVLMEVETGDIKAIANLSRMSDGTYNEQYNYAIGESTEPGSTFKLASLMAALEDGYIKLSDSIDTEGGKKQFYDRVMKDSHEGGYGKLTIKEAFALSSNVAISKIISENYGENPQKFIDKIKQFKLNEKLNLSIPGEGNPKIKNPGDKKDWSGVTLPWMSIGYESRLTPLQILTFYNAVANDGKMVKPRFVKQVVKRNNVIKEYDTEVIEKSIASSKTIKEVKKALEMVVEKGTASNLKNANYKIAGKTGTAQIANDKYGYKYEQKISYQASFVGYFPAENPKYSCIVVVNAPSNAVYYGNLVAGPIFKEIADKVFSTKLEIHKQLNTENLIADKPPISKNGSQKDLKTLFKKLNVKNEIKSPDAEWVRTTTMPEKVIVNESKVVESLVPNVIGMGLKDAVYLLENNGLVVRVIGRGEIKRQSITPGQKIAKGNVITLELI